MRISEIIGMVDKLKPNAVQKSQKIVWLSELDGRIHNDVLKAHEGCTTDVFRPYDIGTDSILLVDYPHDGIYRWWLEAMIDLANAEYVKYNNDMAMYNEAYKAFVADYHTKHMPVSHVTHFKL